MAVERVSGGTSLIDVLDRVLDKGIVIDNRPRVSTKASIETGLADAAAVGLIAPASRTTSAPDERAFEHAQDRGTETRPAGPKTTKKSAATRVERGARTRGAVRS